MNRATLLLALAAGACTPTLDDRASRVTALRVMAVQSEPAEAAPGESVALRVLYADAHGAVDPAPVDWAFCTAPKPLAETGPIATSCLRVTDTSLTELGVGTSVTGVVPHDACSVFGPDPPAARPGQPAGRPVDPDPTGGYYQPLRLLTAPNEAPVYAVASVRVACGLAGATQDQAAAFARAYHRNTNPAIASLTIEGGGVEGTVEPETDAPAVTISPGGRVIFRAHWAACPSVAACGDGFCTGDESAGNCPADCTSPVGCTGAEAYPVVDPDTRALVPHAEAMVVSWFAGAGAFDAERGGPEGDGTTSSNGWTAPAAAGDVAMQVVLRDDRGGVAWHQYRIHVGP